MTHQPIKLADAWVNDAELGAGTIWVRRVREVLKGRLSLLRLRTTGELNALTGPQMEIGTSPFILCPIEAERRAILPSSLGFAGTGDRAWIPLLRARSSCALSLGERRLACFQHAWLAGKRVPQNPADEPTEKLLGKAKVRGLQSENSFR